MKNSTRGGSRTITSACTACAAAFVCWFAPSSRTAYSAIPDIEAALQGLDDFYSKEPADKQRAWFVRASRALANQHQDFLAKNPQAKRRRHIPDVRDLPDEPLWPPEEARQ